MWEQKLVVLSFVYGLAFGKITHPPGSELISNQDTPDLLTTTESMTTAEPMTMFDILMTTTTMTSTNTTTNLESACKVLQKDEKIRIMAEVASWDRWWTYDGIAGPLYWGLINPAWAMCNKGRRQSPINIEPTSLSYDNRLGALSIDKHLINAKITNTGRTLLLKVSDGEAPIIITGGPLAYSYQFQEMRFHWGEKGFPGSEHSVNKYLFPAEIQLYGFNSDLYQSLGMARENPGGILGVAIMIQVKGESTMDHDHMDSALGHIIPKLSSIKYKGDVASLSGISIASIMPSTSEYFTYEGSTTFPGCWETVTWVVMNEPVYISSQELDKFYHLRQMKREYAWEETPLGPNLRPRQALNTRLVRTNSEPQTQKLECKENLTTVKEDEGDQAIPAD